jgi:energy-coupling factor transporter ATP-binding protein EcfA2
MVTGVDRGQLAAVRHDDRFESDRPTAIRLHSSHARAPVVIEFIGVSGSGKSTLCSAMASALREDGFTLVTADDYLRWRRQPLRKKLSAVLKSGLRTWCFVLYAFWFLHDCASLRGRRLISMGYHLTCMQVWLSQAASREPSVPILLDGFAWPRLTNWLRYRPATDLAGAQLRRTVELFYPRCEVYWIFKTVPVEIAEQRISSRSARAKRAPEGIERSLPDRRNAALRRQMHLYELICDALRARHGEHVQCVDGAAPIPEQVRLVKDAVVRLLQAPTAAPSSTRLCRPDRAETERYAPS